MPLRLDLDPFDELHFGKFVLKNWHERAVFEIVGRVPLLQGRDFLEPASAVGALEKLYCCLQTMYLEEAHEEHQGAYLACAASSLSENPSLSADLHLVDQLVVSRQHFKALKILRKLIPTDVFKNDKSKPEAFINRVQARKSKTS